MQPVQTTYFFTESGTTADEIDMSLKEYEEGIQHHILTQKSLPQTTIFSKQSSEEQTFTSLNREDENIRRVKSAIFKATL